MGWIQISQPRVGAGLDYSGSARLPLKYKNGRPIQFSTPSWWILLDMVSVLMQTQREKTQNMDAYWNWIQSRTINHKRNHVSNQEWTFRFWGVNLIACGFRFELLFMQILKEKMWIRREGIKYPNVPSRVATRNCCRLPTQNPNETLAVSLAGTCIRHKITPQIPTIHWGTLWNYHSNNFGYYSKWFIWALNALRIHIFSFKICMSSNSKRNPHAIFRRRTTNVHTPSPIQGAIHIKIIL